MSLNLRWILGNFADPEFNLTPAQQHEVTWLAHSRHLKRTTLNLTTLALTIGGLLIVGFGWEPMAGALARAGVQPARWISLVILVATVCIAAAWLYRFIYVRPVRMAMREMGHDVCIDCGYRLTGLNADIPRCPECGGPRLPPPAPVSSDDRSATR